MYPCSQLLIYRYHYTFTTMSCCSGETRIQKPTKRDILNLWNKDKSPTRLSVRLGRNPLFTIHILYYPGQSTCRGDSLRVARYRLGTFPGWKHGMAPGAGLLPFFQNVYAFMVKPAKHGAPSVGAQKQGPLLCVLRVSGPKRQRPKSSTMNLSSTCRSMHRSNAHS